MSTNFISQILQKKEIISATKNLFVFNPEHDLALGVGQGPYTPPAEVVKLRKLNTLLPALYAGNGDFILDLDERETQDIETLPFYAEYLEKNLRILNKNTLREETDNISKIIPWGWDPMVRQTLIDYGIPEYLTPEIAKIDEIRHLSHRRTVIPFRESMSLICGLPLINVPKELFSETEVELFLKEHPLAYFKAPWSSSGRGLVVTDHIKEKGLREWCHGVIKKQGSVIGEPAWNRVFDFATEWEIKAGEPQFMGYSVFETSSRGKYHGNIEGSQEDLYQLIMQKAPEWKEDILEAQQETIKKLISPGYDGFLGIDMLSDNQGMINPCVEINLRLTMGHVNLLRKEKRNI